jgi:hypothetical protein
VISTPLYTPKAQKGNKMIPISDVEIMYSKIACLVKQEAKATRDALEAGLLRLEERQQAKPLPVGSSSLDGGLAKLVALPPADNISEENDSLEQAKPKTREMAAHDKKARMKHVDTWRLEIEYSFFKRTANTICGPLIEWFKGLDEPVHNGKLENFVQGRSFEFLCMAVILANCVQIFVATNFESSNLGVNLPLPLVALDLSFLLFYIVELALKLYVHHGYYFCNDEMGWNIFDFSLVVLGVADQILSEVFNVKFMRSFRILKLAKVLRIFRLMRLLRELKLILNCLIGSVASLTWSIVMMVLIFFMFGACFVQGSVVFLVDADLDPDAPQRTMIDLHFGSVEGAILTLFMAATGGDDWSQFYRALKPAGDGYCFMFLFFVAFTQIAFLNILTGLFVENAMKLAQPERDALALEDRKHSMEMAERLKSVCARFENDGDGMIELDEFVEMMKDEGILAQLRVLGIDVKDSYVFFKMLEDATHDSKVSIDDLVNGCLRMSGPASSFDLQRTLYENKARHTQQRKALKDLQKRTARIGEVLEMYGHPDIAVSSTEKTM